MVFPSASGRSCVSTRAGGTRKLIVPLPCPFFQTVTSNTLHTLFFTCFAVLCCNRQLTARPTAATGIACIMSALPARLSAKKSRTISRAWRQAGNGQPQVTTGTFLKLTSQEAISSFRPHNKSLIISIFSNLPTSSCVTYAKLSHRLLAGLHSAHSTANRI